MPSVAQTMKAKVGWDESYARKVRLITGGIGLVLLFCGIVCQWWAGNNFADVPLSTLCKSFSGMPDVMEREDFFNGKKSYYERVGENGPPITLQMVANQFVGENYDDAHPVDQFLYSNPSFWCKYLPACPPGAKCQATPGHGMTIVEREPWVRAGWVGRKVSENPSWAQATGVQSFTSTHIRCHDKATVYKRMLEAVFTDMKGNWVTDAKSGARWSQDSVDTAAREMEGSCMRSKGSAGYVTALGPVLSTMTCLICLLSLCRWFQGPTTASAAEGFSIVSVALTLVGFFFVNFRTDSEFMQAYMICGGSPELLRGDNPMVKRGVYFDSTPCLDLNSDGDRQMNPFVRTGMRTTAVYVAGGVCNLIATILLLVSISKIKEKSKLSRFQTLEASDEL